MVSVTGRVRMIRQPYGGYVRPRDFECSFVGDGGINDLNPRENVFPGLVGSAVDYLTRLMTGETIARTFVISYMGACNVSRKSLFFSLLSKVRRLDDSSIRAAIQLSGFDSAYRAGILAYRPVEKIEPDEPTVENVRTMVKRSLVFFKEFGPKVLDYLTFQGGYTKTVNTGDGDFLTKDTLWDFKVSREPLNSRQTLQVLIYWRMGLHSIHKEYQSVKYLGIYNPRSNTVYRINVNRISDQVIRKVDKDVIGY